MTSYHLSNVSPAFTSTYTASTFTAVVTPVTNGVTYNFTLAASNDTGLGPAAAFNATQAATTPGVPTGITVQALGATSTTALVQWSTPVATGGATLRRNLITFVPLDSNDNEILNSTFIGRETYATDPNFRYVSPIGRLNYHVYVQAYNDRGYSPRTAYSTLINAEIVPLGGLELWMDAADATTITTSGSDVTAWLDKSPYSKTTIMSGNKPTLISGGQNGLSTIQFNGGAANYITSYLTSAIGTGDFSFFTVWKATANTDILAVVGIGGLFGGSGTCGMGWNPGNEAYNIYDWATTGANYYASYNQWVVQIGQRTSSLMTTLVNNNPGVTSGNSPTNFADSTLTVGAGPGFPFYTTGEIAEVLIYKGTVTASTTSTIQSYLAIKWGINMS